MQLNHKEGLSLLGNLVDEVRQESLKCNGDAERL